MSDPLRIGPTLRGLVLAFPIVLLVACGGESPAGPDTGGDGAGSIATIDVTPGADTLTALGDSRAFEAVARDAEGNEVGGISFSWSTSDASVATVDGSGIVTAEGNGTAEVTASASGVTGGSEVAVIQRVETVVVSPTAATLTTVGATQQFTASATDSNDNAVEGVAFVWDSEDPTVATVDRNGLVTSKGAGISTISATAQDVPGYADLTVNQDIDRVAFRVGPTSAVAGEAIDPALQVEVVDADGNRVEDAEIAITLSLGANPGGGSLGGSKTVTAVSGVATFSGLWVDMAASGYTLMAGAEGTVTGDESAPFDISPGSPAQVAVTGQPSDAVAGEAISPAVEAEIQDQFGNTVTDATTEISVSLVANPGGGTLAGSVTAAASSGVATFSDLSIDKAASGYKLGVNATSLSGDASAGFQITPASPTKLGFTTQPSGVEGQEPIAPAVEVTVQDRFGNTVSSSSADVTLSLEANPTSDRLSGTTTATTVDGVATFSDLSVALPSRGYTLLAAASGLSSAESEYFFVTLTFSQTSAGREHSCGLTVAQHVYCWGDNELGSLGDGTNLDSSTPVAVDTDATFTQVSAGGGHSCGITASDEALCWGTNSEGTLGDGTTTHRSTPVAVATSESFVQISAGNRHTCGVTTAQEVLCWGLNNRGQLGDGTTTSRSSPVLVSSQQTFAQVSPGRLHTCAVTTADSAYCWGGNFAGQLGDGTTTDRVTPVAVSTAESFVQVSGGGDYNCAVSPTNEGFCWGDNAEGQLGDGTTTDRLTPVPVSTAESLSEVTAGDVHTCAVTTADGVLCWGDNSNGQLGDGTTSASASPAPVNTTESFVQVSVGGFLGVNPIDFTDDPQFHTCGVTTVDEVFCWGDNTDGKLGDGTTTDRLEPTLIVH